MSNDPVLSAASRVQRVRHELKRRTLRVVRVQVLSPGLRRVTFGGDDLADFVSLSFDDHIKLLVPASDGVDPVARDYTPRRFDPVTRELSIDFQARNLTNQYYEYVWWDGSQSLHAPAPQRSFFASATWRY